MNYFYSSFTLTLISPWFHPYFTLISLKIWVSNNVKIRKIVEKLKSDLTALELRNGKIQVALPKPQKQQAQKSKKESTNQKQESKPEAKKEEKTEEKPKKEKKQKESKPKAAPAPPADDKPIDVSRLSMKVGKIVECVKHPGKNMAFAWYFSTKKYGAENYKKNVQMPMHSIWRKLNVEKRNPDKLFPVWSNIFQLRKCKIEWLLFFVILNQLKWEVSCQKQWSCVHQHQKKLKFWRPQAEQHQAMSSLFPVSKVYFWFLLIFLNFPDSWLLMNLGAPDEMIKPTNKKAVSIFEQVAPDLKTNDNGEASYKVSQKILGHPINNI